MTAIIYISGEIGKETTLKDVIRQFKSYEEPTSVLARITSAGGDVVEGDGIYDYLKGLKASLPVNTWTNKAYSISAKIFSVGEIRTVEEGDKRVMIHFAWANVTGKAEKLEIVAEHLREMENEFASYYSAFLDIDEDTARNLLDNDTMIDSEEALDLGFATEIQASMKAVAKYDSNNFKTSDMNKNEKTGNALMKMLKAYFEKDNAEVKALVLQDSDANDVDFADLEIGDVPKVGDVATVDDKPVADGERIMPSLDNATVIFVDGKVSEVIPSEEEEETEEEIQARLAVEKATKIKAEEVQQISVWSQEATNTSFEVGDAMTYEYDGETYNYSAGEFFVPSLDKNVVTDASGIIVAHKDKIVLSEVETEEEVEASAQVVEELIKGVETKVSAKFQEQLEAQQKEIKGLKKMVSSKEFKAEQIEEVPDVVVDMSKGGKILAARKRRNKN